MLLNEVILRRIVLRREVYDQYVLAASPVVVRRRGPGTLGLGSKSQIRK